MANDLTPVQARQAMDSYLKHPARMEQLADALQNTGVTLKPFLAAVVADTLRQPKLAVAIQQAPESLMEQLSVCAASGLLPGSAYGQFYLIPRWSSKRSRTEITSITGYKGLSDMAYRHERVHSVMADCVFIGEQFEYDPGEQRLVHKWNPVVKRETLEDLQAVYARVQLATPNGQHAEGAPLLKVMTLAEVMKAREMSETGKKGYGPWFDHPFPMASKTPLRRLLTGGSVPRRLELIQLLGHENEQDDKIRSDALDETEASGRGLAGLRSTIGVQAVLVSTTDADEARARLASLRPDLLDLDLMSDQDVLDIADQHNATQTDKEKR